MVFQKPQQVHRSGLLKQQNKEHKHGRHRSKNELDKVTKGRVEVKVATKRARRDKSRMDRKRQASQIRKNKRDEIVAKKRALGSQETPPFLVAVVPLGSSANPGKLLKLVKNCDQDAIIKDSPKGLLHISLPRFRQRYSLIVPPPGDLYATLDIIKVADTVVFLVAPDPDGVQSIAEGSLAPTASSLREGILGFDAEGGLLLTSVMAQGLPSPVFALTDLDRVPQKRRGDMKKTLQKQIEKVYPLEKLEVLDTEADALRLLHQIGSQKQRPVFQRDQRPHLLAEKYTFIPYEHEKSMGTLAVEGYLRGQSLSANDLVHIPGWGDFQLSQILGPQDPYPLITSQRKRKDEMEDLAAESVLDVADPEKQESLQAENELDPMEGEQTWPTADDMKGEEEEEDMQEESGKTKRVPKGTSEYQAAWIKEVLEAGEESGDDSDSESGSDDEDMTEDDESDDDNGPAEDGEDSDQEDMESIAVTESGEPERYDKKVSFNLADEEEDLDRIKKAREDAMWPDEVDTPRDVPARVRFQKYRGLQSFRTSPWDPKENLPSDYSRIFQFENFSRTRKRVLQAEREGVEPGTYVRLMIKDVPEYLVVGHSSELPLTVVGVLPHEQKMSVVHLLLKRPLSTICGEQLPLQSKDKLILHVGYRRFIASPIYSQHTSGNKHKYERFFRPESTVVATVYAPIMYPPASVLAFQEKHGTQQLVATGSVMQVNPDRIITKRIVLSGHSFKVHKKSAVVRFMFFNREDIEWFKPVELRTKYGRRGHIREPLGTHGHMKCVFDGQIKSQDTVLMNLYKRVFPKWVYETRVPAPPPLYQTETNLTEDDIMA